jgi:multidrug efflux pump subunit AcrA (membrane-fusion protein)
MFKKIKFPSRKISIIIGAVLLVIAGGFGYFALNQKSQKSSTFAQTYGTSTVRKGDISISAAGTGTLVANRQASLSFSIDGYVESVNATVGEKVTKGQVLAKLQNLSSLSTAVTSTNLALVTANQALQKLKDEADATLGNAQLTLSTDKKALDDAQTRLIKPGYLRCDQKTTSAYYDNYMRLQNKYTELNDGSVSGNYYLTVIVPSKDAALKAFAIYKNCAEYKPYEIDASNAKLNLAQAKLKIDQTNLDTLQKNNGIDPVALATAQNDVAVAQAAYDVAKNNQQTATLIAPFDGTILTVGGLAGDSVLSKTVFITEADDTHPQVQFVMDESDLQKIALDETADITFDAIENQKFTGTVTQVNPSLQTVSNYRTVQGLVTLNLDGMANPPVLFQGLTASVTLYQGKSTGALLIPVAALRDLGNGQFGVFTVEKDRSLKLKIVTVGLKDTSNAEILSGLQQGETVTTGLTETK